MGRYSFFKKEIGILIEKLSSKITYEPLTISLLDKVKKVID
jgi:hypothetical protein